MDVCIRIASLQDSDCLIRLVIGFRDISGDDFPTEESLQEDIPKLLADDSTEFFIADLRTDHCLGFLQQRYRYSLWLSAPEAYVEDLFVAEDARRQGVGRRLVEFAVDRATARGCPLIRLVTTERNKQAARLYQTLGFSHRSPRSGLRLLFRRWLGTGPAPWQTPG